MRILILGGYGIFGGRLIELLAGDERLELLVAGRSVQKAKAFIGKLKARATIMPVLFDREGDCEGQLRENAVDLVVDCSGPFQLYGEDPYRVVKAAVALGLNYLDLADGADFVAGIKAFDAAAKARGVFVLSGVSSFPVLTAAVVRKLSEGLAKLETITAGIAPSPYAVVGLNVIRAVSSYAGKPVRLRRDGKDAVGYGFVDTRRYTIRPPGYVPLRPRTFALVDVPDLRALPELWPEVRSVWMGAAPMPGSLHGLLRTLAGLVRRGLLPSLSGLAPLMHLATNRIRWGEHRGGMFVEVEGKTATGDSVSRSWHLLAEGDDGPYIPSMAVAAVVAKCLAGNPPAQGARPATGDLEVADYEPLFANRTIFTGTRDNTAEAKGGPLYRRAFGNRFAEQAPPIANMHDVDRPMRAAGRADIDRGTSLLARLIASVMRFPPAGRDVPVTVTFRPEAGGERWQRDFGGRRFESFQSPGRGPFEGLVPEHFGPLVFGLALVLDEGRIKLVHRGWTAFGLPMPRFLAPTGATYESGEDGRFNFHVEIALPLIGPIVAYRGWLASPEPI